MKNTIVLIFLFAILPCFAQNSLMQTNIQYKNNDGSVNTNKDTTEYSRQIKPSEGSPNVLLMLLNDAGFGQFNVTGGSVASPNMNKLFTQAVLYNHFYTTGLSSPTRAALLTGHKPKLRVDSAIASTTNCFDDYIESIQKCTATIGEILKHNGYATAWFGENCNTPVSETGPDGPYIHWPNEMGFEYFLGFNGTEINQFRYDLKENINYANVRENKHLITLLADRTIAYLQRIEAMDSVKPWFVYLAPAATHCPHQAPKEWINKYKGQFDTGWDEYRKQTFERQKELGVIPGDAKLTSRPKNFRSWKSLTNNQKKLYSRMMEVYAAYGAHVDYEMGRVLDFVHSLKDGDNTLIIYI